MNKKDGGPAFPIVLNGEAMGEMQEGDGMTLRDYFAAAAMQGICANMYLEKTIQQLEDELKIDIEYQKYIPKLAYGLADAMLKEREK